MTVTKRGPDPCPCTSGAPYEACCAAYHRGHHEPPDPVALVRARFAAFAKRDCAFLERTFHSSHEERARPRDELVRELRESVQSYRYLSLRILASAPEDASGIARVLFVARVFLRGQDRSFAELSEFAREDGSWRYLAGEGAPMFMLGDDPDALCIDSFAERAAEARQRADARL